MYAKDPEAILDYAIDWAAFLGDGETIAQSLWHITPSETDGLALLSESESGTNHLAMVSGGVPGHVYRLTNRVTTDLGRTDDRSFLIRIIET